MTDRIHRGFTPAALVILFLAAGCGGDAEVETPGPPPVPPAVQSAPPGAPPGPGGRVETGWRVDPGLMGASRTIREAGDVNSAQQQYQAVLEQARESGDADLERGAALGLARTAACLGEKDAALKRYDELWRDPAASEPDLTLYWDALSSGFSYRGLGDDAKAQEAFRRASQVLEDVPDKLPWFEGAGLVSRWLQLRAGDASAEAEVQQAVQAQKGNFSGPPITFLRLERGNLKGCGLDLPAADIDAFATELGLDQDPVWTSTGPPPAAR